ncbi:uncharacterized protein LOC120326547 isoform X2 [Styela clava]
MFKSVLILLFIFENVAMQQESWELEFDPMAIDNGYFGENWFDSDDKIETTAEDYDRHRRQTWVNRYRLENERDNVQGDNDDCPNKCTCRLPHEVHCTFKFLTHLPKDIPQSVRKLNVAYNRLTNLRPRSLIKFGINLRSLYLNSNNIRILANGLFSEMFKLEVLRLSWNKLAGIRKSTFQGLLNLQRLSLDNNHLTFIHPLAFRGLVSLKLLQLDGNRLSRLQSDVFVTIEFQRFFNNLWDCTCEAKWMKSWIQDKNKYKCKRNSWRTTLPLECAMCNSPLHLKGEKLENVHAGNFTCEPPRLYSAQDWSNDEPLKRRFNLKEIDLKNENLLFRCSGLTSTRINIRLDSHRRSVLLAKCNFSDVPVVTVTENGRSMNSSRAEPDSTNFTKSYSATFTAHLQCDIEYPENPTILNKIITSYLDKEMLLTERRKRYQKSTLNNQRAYSISVANMSAIPAIPLTTASISNVAEFPLYQHARVTFQSRNMSVEKRKINVQYYTSFTHVHTATDSMELIKRPWVLIKQPNPAIINVEIALEGRTAILKCKTVGNPKPKVDWVLPNGKLIHSGETTDKVTVTKSGKLILRNPEITDAGLYRCIATATELESSKSLSTEHKSSVANEIATLKLYVSPRFKDSGIPNVRFHTNQLQLETVEWNGNFSFRFPIEASPESKFAWITPSNQLITSDRRVRQSGVRTNQNGGIEIYNFQKSHEGLYRFIAANIAGIAEYSVYVGIKTTDDQHIETVEVVSENEITDPVIPPVLLLPKLAENIHSNNMLPSNKTPKLKPAIFLLVVANEGDRVELDCNVTGMSSPKYGWYFPNNLTNSDVEGKIQLDDSKLILREVTLPFQGFYRCIAKNESGSSELIVNLTLERSPDNLSAAESKNQTNPTIRNIITTLIPKSQSSHPHETDGNSDDVITTPSVGTDVPPTVENARLTSPKRSHFLDTPADYIPRPIVITARNRTHRKYSPKPITQKPTADPNFDMILLSEHSSKDEDPTQLVRFSSQMPDSSNVLNLSNPTNLVKQPSDKAFSSEQTMAQVNSTVEPSAKIATANISGANTLSSQESENDSDIDLQEDFTASVRDIHTRDSTPLMLIKTSSEEHENPQSFSKAVRSKQPNFDLDSTLRISKPTLDEENKFYYERQKNKSDIGMGIDSMLEGEKHSVKSTRRRQRVHFRPPGNNLLQNPFNKLRLAASFVNKTISATNLSLSLNQNALKSVKLAENTSNPMQNTNNEQPSVGDDFTFELPISSESILYKFSSTLHAEYEGNAVLPCLPPGYDQQQSSLWSFTWTLPSGKVLTRPHKTFSSDMRQFVHMNGSLLLRTLDAKDEGFYECYAMEIADNVEHLTQITLNLVAQRPRILGSQHQYIGAGYKTSVTVRCSAKGKPKPRITWETPGGQLLNEGDQHARISVRKDSTLHIANILPKDAGSYKCKAVNVAGEKSKLVRIQLTSYPPRFIGQRQGTRRVASGQSIILSCAASGYPTPSFKWILPDNSKMQANQATFRGNSRRPKYFIANNGAFLLNNAESSDSGRYICIASNSIGRNILNVNLIVQRSPL